MKKPTVLMCLFMAGVFFLACQPANKSEADKDMKAEDTKPTMTKADSVKRGEYLVTIMGCNDCHTPKVMTDHGPEPDKTRLLSGHPANEPLPKITDKSMVAPGHWILINSGLTSFTGPWGTSFTANLTPDETGTGNWTFENFRRVLKEGKFKGLENGRPILPPMPWQNFANATEEDLHYMWEYLKSLPPIKNVVPEPLPPVAM
jgi:hypothetical protein